MTPGILDRCIMCRGFFVPLQLIKVGFGAFGITADMTGSKMLFAGIRFMAAGLIVLAGGLAAVGIYIINKGKN